MVRWGKKPKKPKPDIKSSVWRLDRLAAKYTQIDSSEFAELILGEAGDIRRRIGNQVEFERFIGLTETASSDSSFLKTFDPSGKFPNAKLIYPAIKSAYEKSTGACFNVREFSDYVSFLTPKPRFLPTHETGFWGRVGIAGFGAFFGLGAVAAADALLDQDFDLLDLHTTDLQALEAPDKIDICAHLPEKCTDPDNDGIPNILDPQPFNPNVLIKINYFQGSNETPPQNISHQAKIAIQQAFAEIGVTSYIDDGISEPGQIGGKLIRPTSTYKCVFVGEDFVKSVDSECNAISRQAEKVKGAKMGVIEDSPITLLTARNTSFMPQYNDFGVHPYFHYVVVAPNVYNGGLVDGVGTTPGFVSLIRSKPGEPETKWVAEAFSILHELGHNFNMPHNKNPNSIVNDLTESEQKKLNLPYSVNFRWLPEEGMYIRNEGLKNSFSSLEWKVVNDLWTLTNEHLR